MSFREPRSLDGIITRIVDDLLTGQKTGYPVTDYSRDLDDPTRNFRVKMILLLWIGDYPAQAKICNMKHSGKFGCHWCMQPFDQIGLKGYNLALNQRSFLPRTHSTRTSTEFGGTVNISPPPAPRTHVKTMQQGMKSQMFAGISVLIFTTFLLFSFYFTTSFIFRAKVQTPEQDDRCKWVPSFGDIRSV